MLVDVSERKQAETQQRVLMRELNHRVKNNMQMLQSLLFTATRQTQNGEARKVLEDAANRITAMAAAQRVLYDTPDLERFSAGKFLDAVCGTAQQLFPSNVKIIFETTCGQLENDMAMPLALILNELLTNAVKYGALSLATGRVRVDWSRGVHGELQLRWVETGGPSTDLPKRGGFGTRVITQIVRHQLNGKVRFDWLGFSLPRSRPTPRLPRPTGFICGTVK